MKQKILGIARTYSRRLVGITDQKEMAVSVPEELRSVQSKVTKSRWLDEFETGDK